MSYGSPGSRLGVPDGMHRRFVCEDCRTKWFVRAGGPVEDDPTACAGCGGALRPLVEPGPEAPESGAVAP